MKQQKREPKKSFEKIQKIQEIAYKVIERRGYLLQQFINQKEYIKNIEEMKSFYYGIIENFKYQNSKLAGYRLQLLICGTRSWEGSSLDSKGKARFQIEKIQLITKINSEFLFNKVILSEDVQIERIRNDHKLLNKVQANLLRNSQVLKDIFQEIPVERSITLFFIFTKFYTVQYIKYTKEYVQKMQKEAEQKKTIFLNPNNLFGLSSFDGSKTYVNKQLYDDAVDQFNELEKLHMITVMEPQTFDSLNPIRKLLTTLEHECCHNIPRWYSLNTNPFLLSPEKNENLRIENMFQEAGHYYAARAYLIESIVSPFCINAKYQEDI